MEDSDLKRVLVNAGLALVITTLASLAIPVAYSPKAQTAESAPAATLAVNSTSHAGISLSYDTALASSVWGEVLPRLVTDDGPFWENLPQHVRFILNSYPVPREFWTPNVSVFPVRELLRDQPLVESDVNTLRSLIARRPNLRSQYPLLLTDRPGITPPPYVPPINAGQIVSPKMEYVNFANGSGIRYLTYLSQGLSPISTNGLIYVYQGLTSDGNSYVSVIVPVESAIQRDAPPLEDEQILAYNRDIAQSLDRASNADFTPNLTLLDDMVRSIRIGAAPPIPASYTFPETGFAVSGRIWQAWLGGRQYDYSLYINGYPISELRSETSPTDGKIYQTQWFERARFELHPENAAPFDVLLGLLGVAAAQGRESEAPFQPVDMPEDFVPWFPETRHTLGDSSEGGQAISQWWIRLGGLPQFGYPISQPFREISREDGKEYLVQYFERQRFEYHPEKKGTEYEVLLGRLGAEQMK
jgi:hypothetical protein